jgi:Leucine-rich repeat (LRR) protein
MVMVMGRIPSLETLDLSRNKLEEIEQGAFEGANSIREM